jgi:hypothetical protein
MHFPSTKEFRVSSPRRMAGALAAAAALTAACGATAQAAPTIKIQNARFKIVVQGVQTTVWTHKHTKAFDCDTDSQGSGTEVVRFKTAPTIVDVMQVDKYAPMLTVKNKYKGFYAPAKITRRGTYTTGNGKICSYGDGTGGGTPTPAPDCGTKRSGFFFDLDYVSGQAGKLRIERDSMVPPVGPFRNCPVGGVAWPDIMEFSSGSKFIGGKLPYSELFNKRHGQIGARAAGKDTTKTADDQSETTIDWNVLLTRVKTRAGK